MMASLRNSALQIYSIVFVSFPLLAFSATGPNPVLVQQGETAILTCSYGAAVPAAVVTAWLEGARIFASINGRVPGVNAKYDNFDVVNDDSANGQMDLRITDAQYEDIGEYTCQFGASDLPSATLTVQVPATSLTIAIDGVDQSSSATVTEDIAVTLTCTALGAKPQVSIDWFIGSNPLTPDTETVPPGGEATDTRSTYGPFIPTRSDEGSRIECRTGGHQTSQSEFITLNVRFAPVVTSLTYRDGIITCNADANPITNIEYYIILNGTKPSAPTGQTLAFKVDENYCTEVSCNVTNAVGTGSRKLEEPLCPVIPDETTTEMPTTDYVEPTTPAPPKPSDPPTNPNAQSLDPAVLAVIIVLPVVAVLIAVIAILYCYTQKKFCFDSNKTSNGGSSPKKQPSVVNADMIRNQPEVRQSVHNYDDEPKKPRVPRSNSGKPAPEKEALKQSAPPTDNDHQAYPMDSYDGDPQQDRGQAGVNYADLQFQNRDRATNGHGKIHQSDEEPTQYASILV